LKKDKDFTPAQLGQETTASILAYAGV